MLGVKLEGSTIVRRLEAIDQKGNACLVYCPVGFVPLRRFCLGCFFSLCDSGSLSDWLLRVGECWWTMDRLPWYRGG
jgi:hypothetical protein